MNLYGLIKQACQNAATSAFQDLNPTALQLIDVSPATQEQFGHYQCNAAMKLAKIVNMPPRNIAEALVKQLQASESATKLFEKIEVAGPGFINLHLKPTLLETLVLEQLKMPRLGFGIQSNTKKPKVIIDFSSPNVAKEMHVGHLRSTIIGDCLARIFRANGAEVLPLNHIGDWGTQFGMLIAYLKETYPSLEKGIFPELNLSELAKAYQVSKAKFDAEPDFKKRSREEVVLLQGNDPVSKKIWLTICDISRSAYQTIYEMLDITLVERGESFYEPYLANIVKTLEDKGLVSLSEGAKCVFLEGFTNREGDPQPLIIQKSDGAYNYATTDLAAIQHRVKVEKGEWLIYVIDAGQSLHLQMVFETAKLAGFWDPNHQKISHVSFGLVLRPDGKKFKTRAGDTEKLIDLLNAAKDKSKELLKARHPDLSEEALEEMAKTMGMNAVKYADLSCNRNSDYVFSYDKMLKFEGNTAAFLMYAYVRIKSIQRKTAVNIPALIQENSLKLEHPLEIALGLLICQFNEELEKTLDDLMPSRLTDYLYRLSEKFHLFFHTLRVEGSSEQNSRLLLCEAVSQILSTGFQMLGLKPMEKM